MLPVSTLLHVKNLDWEKTRRKLHKNAACCSRQILEAASHKTAAVRVLSLISQTIQVRRTKHTANYLTSKDELINSVLQWTPTHGHTNVGRPVKTHIH